MENIEKLSLVELRSEYKSLIRERKKLDSIAKKDPTFSDEKRQQVLEGSIKLISESKERLDSARDELKQSILELKAERDAIKNHYRELLVNAQNEELRFANDSVELVSECDSIFEKKLAELLNKVAELKQNFGSFKNEQIEVINDLKVQYKAFKANKEISFEEKDREIELLKNQIFQIEHELDREKTLVNIEVEKLEKEIKLLKKSHQIERKGILNPKAKKVSEIKKERKERIKEINIQIDEVRENLKFYNTFGYKTCINTRNKFINFGKNLANDFSSLDNFKEWLIRNILYIIVILFVIIVTISSGGTFLSWRSIVNVLTQTSFRLPIALGVAGIIVLTGTDLSAGRIVGLTGLMMLILSGGKNAAGEVVLPWTSELNGSWMIVVLLIGLAIGAAFGAFNGFFVAKFQIHPFIVTLSTQLIIYGLVQLIASPDVFNASTTSLGFEGLPGFYRELVTGGFMLFGVKISWYVIYAIILVALVWFIWNKTKMGKNMFAVGCNQEAATVSGISVFKTILVTFIFAGALYAISGFEVNPVLGGASVDTGTNFELDAITAAVIGGVSFTGGIGKVSGVVIGAIFLQLITAGLQTMGVGASYIYIIKGAVILLATALDMKKYIQKK